MQAQFDSIFKELGAAAAVGAAPIPELSASSSKPTTAAAATTKDQVAADLSADASFQETIRRTMERMQTSGQQATAAAAAEGSEEDFSKMLMGMMEQLTNKEILYEPMRELNEKFPGWMEKNKDTVKEEDRKRYVEQQKLVLEMVTKFEEPTYKDENVADREYIVDRMQRVSIPPMSLCLV
jgi:peroxin-19